MKKVTIIDYGVGNLLSVKRGLEYCDADVKIVSDREEILNAERIVLPGVGAFANAMKALEDNHLKDVILQKATSNTPLLAICLGMQMLLDESEEFGLTTGLKLIPGKVKKIPSITVNGVNQKIPHIGWNELIPANSLTTWNHPMFAYVHPNESVYFVHSFMAIPENTNHRIADCMYGGYLISGVIGFNNIIGCQFHPEKSADVGLRILKEFLNL